MTLYCFFIRLFIATEADTAASRRRVVSLAGGKSTKKRTFLLLLLLLAGVGCTSSDLRHPVKPIKVSTADIDWDSFLARHDMYWTRFDTAYPDGYFSGVLLGNGLLGVNLYKENERVYRFNAGRTDVTEGRINYPVPGYQTGSHLFDEARLPVGSFRLTPVGAKVNGDTARLSLYDAVAQGTIATDSGRIEYRLYVHALKDLIVLETLADAGEADYSFVFHPDEAVSPRLKIGRTTEHPYYAEHPNPPAENNVRDGDYILCIQPLLTGRAYVAAWREQRSGGGTVHNRRILATIAYENSVAAAVETAKRTLDEAFATESAVLEDSHTEWWHNYYPASFVSFNNARRTESFYWAQIYKFACASREGKPIVDILGPWPVDKTPWCAVWMNLNTQLSYSWQATANRPELFKPLAKALNDNKANLVFNARHKGVNHYADGSEQILDTENDTMVAALPRSSHYGMKTKLNPDFYANNQYEVGNLTWLLYYYRQYCAYYNLTEELTTEFFDLLKRAVNYYFHIRKRFESDGKYHLPVTASPEYGSGNVGADVNYDHAVLRWGLQTLMETNDRYGLGDPERAEWVDFLDNLAPYPTDENGYRISAATPYSHSHRHWSHLLMIYPLYLVTPENPDEYDLMLRSIEHWQSMTESLQGYSYSGSSSMYASLGDGERAFEQLDKLIGNETYIRPNTLYYESRNPVFETPMSAVSSLHDMYLQSWGGKIRVFPAVPSFWDEASFIDLRTEGAFLVSAARSGGKTVFIQVESTAGGQCRLQTGMNLSTLTARKIDGTILSYSAKDAAKGLVEFDTNIGDVVQLTDNTCPISYPAPVSFVEAEPWGLNDVWNP